MKKEIVCCVLLAACWQTGSAQQVDLGGVGSQEWSPFAVSVVPPAEWPSENWSVYGVRLNLFAGRHDDVAFLDIGGIANLATGEMAGISTAGLYNQVAESPGALQTAGIVSLCHNSFSGIQVSGVFAKVADLMTGLQVSPIALSGTLQGLQIGVFNRVERMVGLQVGVVNYAYQADGLQIGLLNAIADSQMPVMPLANIGF